MPGPLQSPKPGHLQGTEVSGFRVSVSGHWSKASAEGRWDAQNASRVLGTFLLKYLVFFVIACLWGSQDMYICTCSYLPTGARAWRWSNEPKPMRHRVKPEQDPRAAALEPEDVHGLRFRVLGLGFWVLGSRFKVLGLWGHE